jgi:hypothetical protein
MPIQKMSYRVLLLLFSVSLVLFACSDDALSPDSDPPILPDLENIAPDIDFFESNTPGQGPFDELYSNYYEGSNYALSGFLTYSIFASFPAAFLSFTEGVEPEFKDGKWVWTYSHSFDGESFELRIEADADIINDRIDWEIFLSIDSADVEFNVENFLFLNGFTNLNGSIGEWGFFIPDDGAGESAAFTTKWNIQSATERDLEIRISDPDEISDFVMEYSQSGTEHWMDYSDFVGQEIIQIYWNTANNTGYIQIDDERKCWADNFTNEVSCS